MARKDRDTGVSEDHQYASKMYSYLTPPSTPQFDVLGDNDESSFLGKESFLPEDFDLYSANEISKCDDDDPFYDFAEDFRDLRLPMLKSDCMWGTAALIRSTRTSHDSTSNSVTSCPSRSIVVTPLPLTFRSTSTTPVYFEDRSNMNLFTPITSTVSPSELENENESKEIIPSLNGQLHQSVQLLSPNETESEDEIDVVGVPERPKPKQLDSSTEKRVLQIIDKPNLTNNTPSSSSCNASPNSSDTDDSSSGRTRNFGPHGRVSHNDLERKRRDELKRKFDCLREAVPELESNERAPKVVILKKAALCVPLLENKERALVTEKENLKRVNSLLMQKLLLLANRR